MKTKRVLVVSASALVVAAVAWLSWLLTGAKVTGETLQERVESVYRISADRPHGAAKALAGTASEAPEAELRRAAMAGLMPFASPSVRPVFEKGLSDPDGEVRAIAAGGLGVYGDRSAAGALIETIEKETDDKARHAAMAALARCEDPRSVVVLLNKAEGSGDREDRLAAMKALAGKLRAGLNPAHRPENVAVWRDLVQRLKRMTYVRNAFAAANAPLNPRPEDLLGPDFHPERRTGSGPPPPPDAAGDESGATE